MKAETKELPSEIMELQMGPSHPATHGTIKFNLKLDGEKVLDCDVEVGFLHRGFDKSCEQATWTQVIPYTDRLNYASSLINNVGYALAVEKLIGAETPLRCQYIRVIVSELAHDFAESITRAFKTIRKLLDDCDRLLSRNRIFLDRLSNVGVISQETALSYCLTGPILRASEIGRAHV